MFAHFIRRIILKRAGIRGYTSIILDKLAIVHHALVYNSWRNLGKPYETTIFRRLLKLVGVDEVTYNELVEESKAVILIGEKEPKDEDEEDRIDEDEELGRGSGRG